jgi:hypothetical protein
MVRFNLGFKEASLLIGLTALGAGILSACSSDTEIVEYGDEPDAEVGEDSGSDVMDAQNERTKRDASDGRSDAKVDAVSDAPADARDADADARPKDAGADVVYADTGDPCSPLGLTQTQGCGFCGTRERVCADLADSGNPTWAEWGMCLHSVPDGCNPGEMVDASCGLCGHASVKCGNNCRLPSIPISSCKDQGVCTPNDSEYRYGVSCDAGGRWHTCNDTCQWGDLSECVFEDMPELQVPAVVGTMATMELTFADAGALQKPSTSAACPTTNSGTTLYPYSYVRVMNNTGMDARVSIWHAPSTVDPDAGNIDTIMMLYDNGVKPRDTVATERWDCMTGTTPNNNCTGKADPSMCKSSFAGYTDVDGGLPGNTVVVPAGFFLIVYNTTNVTGTFGAYSLNVMTHEFYP